MYNSYTHTEERKVTILNAYRDQMDPVSGSRGSSLEIKWLQCSDQMNSACEETCTHTKELDTPIQNAQVRSHRRKQFAVFVGQCTNSSITAPLE